MIEKVEEKDYEELVKLAYQVYEHHYGYRLDIYVDGNSLSREYFENVRNNENTLKFVFEEDTIIYDNKIEFLGTKTLLRV